MDWMWSVSYELCIRFTVPCCVYIIVPAESRAHSNVFQCVSSLTWEHWCVCPIGSSQWCWSITGDSEESKREPPNPWWRHQMETFSTLLAICAGNSSVIGEFPTQRPVTRSFDVLFELRLKNGWVNNGDAGDLRRHRADYDVIVMHTDAQTMCRMHVLYKNTDWIKLNTCLLCKSIWIQNML